MSRRIHASRDDSAWPARLGPASRAVALCGLVATLVGCGDQATPTSPAKSGAVTSTARSTRIAVLQTELAADAIGRILPALEKDAAAPVGNALRTLDTKLRDPNATTDARARAVTTMQNVLAQFTDPLRPDGADLDAMRLEIDEIGSVLE
jgi:hypothetical protein